MAGSLAVLGWFLAERVDDFTYIASIHIIPHVYTLAQLMAGSRANSGTIRSDAYP